MKSSNGGSEDHGHHRGHRIEGPSDAPYSPYASPTAGRDRASETAGYDPMPPMPPMLSAPENDTTIGWSEELP
jgi:hypothetical protein